MAEQTPDPAIDGGPQAPRLRPALSRCLSIDSDQFAAQHWGQTPLLSHTPGFNDLFSAAAVDELVSSRGLRTPFLRMARNGQVLPAASFTSGGGIGATVTDQADPAKIHALMTERATLVVQALHRMWPPLQEFARQLQVDLGHPVQVNAYVTPRSAQGFAAHYDTHDVFVIQIAGTKDWRVHRPVVAHPAPSQPWENHQQAVADRAAEAPWLSPSLTPGDCLYLPRGWLHSAVSNNETSIHVTVGIHPLTGVDVASALLDEVGGTEDSLLRHSLPVGSTTSAAAMIDVIEEVRKSLIEAVAAAPAEHVADRLMHRLRESGRPEPVAPLRQLEVAVSLTPDTVVQLREGLHPALSDAGSRSRLTAGGRYLEAPQACADALAAIASGAPVTAATLPGVDAQAGLALVRRAVREAIVVPREH